MKPIVLIHGYSSEGKNTPAEKIYGTLPTDLRRKFGANNVLDINLSRWISLSDGIALDDISFAMQRALASSKYKDLLTTGFHVVIHSTGALVVRNWLRLYSPKPSPIDNLVHLAGANFGSGLAHIGQGTLARWGRQIFQGVEPGEQVLDELEFGASKTLDLHLHFLQPGNRMDADYQVREYCAIGSQTLNPLRVVPVRYVKEDSADNTVRTSACNLNFNYVKVEPSQAAYDLSLAAVKQGVRDRLNDNKIAHDWYAKDLSDLASSRSEIPFALLYETAHFGGDLGIVNGTKTRKQVLPVLEQALSADSSDATRDNIVAAWKAISEKTLDRAGQLDGTITDWSPRKQYEGHSQLIFRLRDQFGAGVAEHDITFTSGGRGKVEGLERMIEDTHQNEHNQGNKTYYLRTQKFKKRSGRYVAVDRLKNVAPLDIEITGHEPRSKDISYLPVRIKITAAQVQKILQPFRTTVVDVTLLRLPTGNVFKLSKAT